MLFEYALSKIVKFGVDLFSTQIDEDASLVPEAFQGGTYGFNSANVPAKGFQF